MCESHSEEMTSFDILPTQNGMPESLDSSEFSLVEDHHLLNEQPANMTNSVHSTFMSAAQDLSENEVQKYLVELVEDNESMKAALKYNNQMMKEQLNTITSWHSQMSTAMSQQQASLNESNKKIQELREEKAALEEKLKLAEVKQDKTEVTPKNEPTPLSDEEEYEIIQRKSKAEDVQKYIDQIKDSESKIFQLEQDIKTQSSEMEILKNTLEEKEKEKQCLVLQLKEHKELKTKIDVLSKETDELKQVKASGEQKMRQLEEKIKVLEENLSLKEAEKVTLELACSDGGNLKTYEQEVIKNLNAKIADLELQLSSKQEVTNAEQEQTWEMLLEQVDKHQDSLKEIKSSYDEKIKEMEKTLKDLQEKLSVEKQISQTEKTKHSETKRLFALLQENFEGVSKQLDLQARHHRAKCEEMTSRQESTEKVLMDFDCLTAIKLDLEQRMEEKEEKIKEMASEIDTLKKDCEKIPILNSQIEVYKIDLNNAVLGKEAASVEVERLKKQWNEFQSQSSMASGSGINSTDSLRGKGRKKAPWKMQAELQTRSNMELIVCPLCGFGFTDLQAAENHCNNCGDKA